MRETRARCVSHGRAAVFCIEWGLKLAFFRANTVYYKGAVLGMIVKTIVNRIPVGWACLYLMHQCKKAANATETC